MYPVECRQPIREEYFLSGTLEKTSESYAIAKIAGIQMCKSYNIQFGTNFISAIPATIYGPEDDFDLEKSHVISALIRKFYEAKKNGIDTVEVWGSGKPRREFIYVSDLVEACLFILNHYNASDIINIGIGEDITIKELAFLIRDIVKFKGEINFDNSKSDGALNKLLSNDKITKLGWKPKVTLREGINRTYKWYTNHICCMMKNKYILS